MLLIMGIAVSLYSFAMFTNVLLQAHGKAHIPVINTLICGVVKLGAMFLLTGNPYVGILGVPICSLLCYLMITVLNLVCIYRLFPQKPSLVKNLLRPTLPAILMGVAVYAVYWLLSAQLSITSSVILCGVPIAVGVATYGVFVLLLKVLTREDCLLLPKGEKLAKLLKL